MALITGVSMKVLINQYDLSGYFRSVNPSMSRGMYDTTTFGSTQHQSTPGFTTGTIEIEGFYEDPITADAPDNVFAAIEGASTPPIVSILPEGWAVNKRAYMIRANESNHTVNAVIDDIIKNNASFQSNDGYDIGLSLHGLIAETSYPVTGTSVDNSAASSNGGIAFLHVSAIAGAAPSITFKVQHSSDNAIWADLVTFTAVTTAGAQRVLVAAGTTVNRYLRMTATNGGTTSSVTGAVLFARR